MLRTTLCLAILIAVACPVDARIKRSAQAVAQFKRLQPCPATALPRGKCPGYIVDHIIALACGGADAPVNMQWQTTPEAKAKDRWERIGCTRGPASQLNKVFDI